MKYMLKIDPRILEKEPDKTWNIPAYVMFSGTVNEESAKKFRRDLEAVESHAGASKQEIIPVVIDSYGGDAYALLSMIDTIKNCELPVATIVESKAMSAGAILFSCGTEGHRYIGKHATVMIHDVASFTYGKLPDLKASTEEADRLNKIIYSVMAKNCGHKNDDYFYDLITERRGADMYLTPENCVKHNLANHIHIPTLETKVSMDINFG